MTGLITVCLNWEDWSQVLLKNRWLLLFVLLLTVFAFLKIWTVLIRELWVINLLCLCRGQLSWKKQKFCKWRWTTWRCFMLQAEKANIFLAQYLKCIFLMTCLTLVWVVLPGYFEAHALAKDYRSLGFRECLAETARYLSVVEGRDATDSLRVRLVSHLSNCASQREVHSGLEHLAWGSAYGTAPAHLPHHLLLQHPQGRTPAPKSNSTPPLSSSSSSSPSSIDGSGQSRLGVMPPTESTRVPPSGSLPFSLPVAASKLSPPLVSSLSSLSSFPLAFGAFPLISPGVASAVTPPSTTSKPYRPWGMEIGAFWHKVLHWSCWGVPPTRRTFFVFYNNNLGIEAKWIGIISSQNAFFFK